MANVQVAIPGGHGVNLDTLERQYHQPGRDAIDETTSEGAITPGPPSGGGEESQAQFFIPGVGTLDENTLERQYFLHGFEVSVHETILAPPTPPALAGTEFQVPAGSALLDNGLLRQYQVPGGTMFSETVSGAIPPPTGIQGPLYGPRLASPRGGSLSGRGQLARV